MVNRRLVHSAAILIFIGMFGCRSATQSQTPAPDLSPGAIPTFIYAETLEANQNYLADCQEEYPHISKSQAGYKDIYPGISTDKDLLKTLGTPNKKIQTIPSETEWIYDLNFAVILEENTVSAIYVGNYDRNNSYMLEPLQDYLSLYGCPDTIFALDGSQHPSGDYDTSMLIFHNIGISISLDGFPVQITDIPFQLQYYSPDKLRDVLAGTDILEDPARARPVFWSELIK